jgi:Probable zinc-ribbon domain
MKSNKQRRAEILARRKARAEISPPSEGGEPRHEVAGGTAPCNPGLLAPYNSYGQPPFVARGFYMDTLFQCVDCGKEEVWRATQQKWWYEVAKGNVETRATRCNACRRAERERRAEARRIHLEGLEKKNASRQSP